MRMLRSQAGLPILWKTVNIPQEEIKAELRRQETEDRVKSEALQSGNYAEARQYPGLRPLISQIEKLSARGKLTPFQVPANTPTAFALAQQLATSNVPRR
jgi:hypothetical protein